MFAGLPLKKTPSHTNQFKVVIRDYLPRLSTHPPVSAFHRKKSKG
jgi:hypothetical protein